jgi:hypothetical protein
VIAEKKTVNLDAYEEGAVIEGLNRIRTEKIEKSECTEFVSDLMLKIIRAPLRRARRRDEAR